MDAKKAIRPIIQKNKDKLEIAKEEREKRELALRRKEKEISEL